jgi:hypothetical protein
MPLKNDDLIGSIPFYKHVTPTGFCDAALPRKIADAHRRLSRRIRPKKRQLKSTNAHEFKRIHSPGGRAATAFQFVFIGVH